MKKKVYQAKLPKAAYAEERFNNVMGYYKHKADRVGWNKWSGERKEVKWLVLNEHGVVYRVICPTCNTEVLLYKDAQKLKPKVVEHCGLKDTFYIGEEL